jgi:hypothetical protein
MNPLTSPARSYPSARSGGGSIEFGVTPLVPGQAYIDVVLTTSLSSTIWDTVCSVVNTVDPAPLNIWPGVVSAKSTTGFTVQLNGLPDSANYFLHWTIMPGASGPAVVATDYLLSGPGSGAPSVASTPFSVQLRSGQTVPIPVTVTPHDGGGSGTFTPGTVNLTTAAPSATFTYTPASTGAKTISVTNNGGLTDPGNLSYLVSRIYYRSLTVDHTKVPSTQTDFPVLVSVTDATLKSVANSGHVAGANGYDIGFFSDSAGTTPLKWEIEKWVATTGELVAWVKIASVSSSADTVFYIRYGDASITTDHSDPVNVWTNNYITVYHLGNGTTLNVNDSLNVANGTNNGATAVAGKVDGGANFVAASVQYISMATRTGPAALTMSCWAKATSFPGAYNALVARVNPSFQSNEVMVKSNGKIAVYLTGTGGAGDPFYDGTGSTTLVAGTWYYVAATYESTIGLIGYINASVDATDIPRLPLNTVWTGVVRIGNDPISASREWNGIIDEARVSSVARSANWITTEFNNQNAPGTFITLGTEV